MMILHVSNPDISIDDKGNTYLTVMVDDSSKKLLQDNYYYISNAVELNLDVQRLYKKRSLNANAMFWSLCGKLADKLENTNDDMYLSLLEKYGAYEVFTVKEGAVEYFKESLRESDEYRIIKPIGQVIDRGELNQQFLCFKGSHKFNTKEMSRLLKETVYECENLGISVYTESDVNEALTNWGNPNG